MPSNSENIVLTYVAALRTLKATGATTAETSFYTPLGNLFNAVGQSLKPHVQFVSQLSTDASSKLPDGGFFPVLKQSKTTGSVLAQRPERGAVEIKPAGVSLAALANTPQVLGYLRDFGLVLITNYHQFLMVRLDASGQPETFEPYDTITEDDLWHAPINELAKLHKDTLPDYLARVLLYKVPIEKPKDLAWLLASYAREAKARAHTHPLAAFDGVKTALQESLGITFEGDKGENFFLSTLIQTLFYGTFSAWVLFKRSTEGRQPGAVFNWRLASTYLRIPVLVSLFHAIAEPGAINTIKIAEILDLAADALNRVQPAFFATFKEEDAVNYFYEPFLEAFDPELRKQLGVWYTPREIVRYMVERVDHLLRSELNEPLGLASPNVQVLDPCCGTGAYLVEVLHKIQRTLTERAGDDNALIASDLRAAATTRIFGFEIMPAPFVIAHLQIASLLEDAGGSLTESQRAQVFLTNALTGWVPARHPQSNFGFPAFMAERDAAEAVKQADTILVILGNPPYNGYAGIAGLDGSQAGLEERDLTTAYASPVEGFPAPQGQGLNDLYIRFFRIAERRISQNRGHRGIVSFISNYSWLDGLSHPVMRRHLIHTFNDVYVDNLHGDRRISEYAPDGRTSETIFAMQGSSVGIKVGTAIATLVKKGNTDSQAAVHYRDFNEARAVDRREHLLFSASDVTGYYPLVPNPALGMPLKPRTVTAQYLGWPRLPEFFDVSFAGVKTSRDALLVDIDREALEARIHDYLDDSISNEEMEIICEDAMASTRRFDAKAVRHELQERGIRRYQGSVDAVRRKELLSYAYRPWQIRRYTYRPFDVRWIYWEPETKLLDEKRSEAMPEIMPGNRFLEARQRESGDHFNRGSIASSLPDNFGGGLSTFFPFWRSLWANEDNHEFGQVAIPNIGLGWQYLYTLYSRESIEDGDVHSYLHLHVLATLHTPQYRTENAGALLGDWPRIPLPATAELLTHSATLGRRLAELLDPESAIELVAEWSFLAKLSIPAELPEGTPDRDIRNAHRLALTAGWGGAGQGATVMPRRGDARERDYTPTELERLTTLAASQSLTLEEALTLLGPRCVDVYLNGDANWTCVPTHVWEYTLGGYQVLKKWLSYRELPLLGRPLHTEEARYFAQVVRRIAAILLMGPALDASYSAILPTATGLPS